MFKARLKKLIFNSVFLLIEVDSAMPYKYKMLVMAVINSITYGTQRAVEDA